MGSTRSRIPLLAIWQREFAGYNVSIFRRDLLAGITTGAVALPLALAFGVAGGATAPAGMVTAILAGILIGGLGGAAFQISGPTGAMSAVLVVLAQRYGLSGIWVACLLAGIFLVLLGVFRLGRYISFIPSPVITGFTSGIALIIAIGQIDNVLGIQTAKADNSLMKLFVYFREPFTPDWHALVIAGIVAVTMIMLPRFTKVIPGSLVGIAIATIIAILSDWHTTTIGAIPSTILLADRLTLSSIPWHALPDLLSPAISIAALGAIESLLCGSVGSTMTGTPLHSNQELIGQGIGNIIIPFFGGVPATAAIARTSVAIKSGAATRVTSLVHSGILLLSVFVLGPILSRVPMAALGGVLMVTAWRMNEWETLHFFVRSRLKHALIGVFVTMIATIALDLTEAILIGIAISALIYLRQSASSMEVSREPVNVERIRAQGHDLQTSCPSVRVYYLTGPIFFGSVHTMLEAFATARDYSALVVSMRGVPLIDVMGARALAQVIDAQHARGGTISFCGLQPAVRAMFGRTGLIDRLTEQRVYWGADQAIVAIHQEHRESGCQHCTADSSSSPA